MAEAVAKAVPALVVQALVRLSRRAVHRAYLHWASTTLSRATRERLSESNRRGWEALLALYYQQWLDRVDAARRPRKATLESAGSGFHAVTTCRGGTRYSALLSPPPSA